MLFATPDDVEQVQADVKAQARGLSDAISAGIQAGKLIVRDPLFQAWKAMVKRIARYLAEEPSWVDANTQVERGHAIESDLQPWYDRLAAAGMTPPAKPAPPTHDPTLEDWAGKWGDLLMLGLIVWGLHEARNL